MIVSGRAPLARAASTKSRCRTWVVTLSEMRMTGGMKLIVSARMVFCRPAPRMPVIAIANRIDGKA